MRIKLIIYEICIKTMSANGSIGKTRSSEVKKNVNHTHILHIYMHIICMYIHYMFIYVYIYTYIYHTYRSIYLPYIYVYAYIHV